MSVAADLSYIDNKTHKQANSALNRLVAAGFLTSEEASYLDRASRLSCQGDMLLEFAVAYKAMIVDRVPINEAIDLAEDLGRRINLNWSAQRWRSERSRFLHMATLKKLASKNVQYDLDAIDQRIKEAARAALIRTSTRLGIEGLCQRYPVEAYHASIQAGGCALASVILDGIRWTVELTLY